MIQSRGIRALICTIAAVALLGCSLTGVSFNVVEVGDLQRDSVTIDREDATDVRVQIRMGAGELNIDKGGEQLMEAEFIYNVEAWEPVVSYEVDDGEGRLTVRQPNTNRISADGRIRNEWDIRLSDQVPLDLRIESGAGDQQVDLAGLQITKLDMKLGAGDSEVNLSNNPELERVDFDMGAGSLSIDVRGPLDQDVDMDIQGGVGDITLRLPGEIGVRVEVNRGIGDIDTEGLSRRGDVWVNEAYGVSEITIDIHIQAGVGEIDLRVD